MTLIVPLAVLLFDRKGFKYIRWDLCIAWDLLIVCAAFMARIS